MTYFAFQAAIAALKVTMSIRNKFCRSYNVVVDPDGFGEWAIEPDNTCKLFCDGHYVATAQCLDGFWTGNPEWGFWCYTEPSVSPVSF